MREDRDFCDMTIVELDALRAQRAKAAPPNIVTPPHRGGRLPCELDLTKVRECAEAGMSYTTAAPLLGCSRRTLINRINDMPAVRMAWQQGLAWAVARAAEKLQERIDAGDLKAITYFLSRKGGFTWREPKRNES
jgi:hypothetical protein